MTTLSKKIIPIAVTDAFIREHCFILNKHETSVVLTLLGTLLMNTLAYNMEIYIAYCNFFGVAL